jgi:membrane associated rhomboid family serine protease
MGQERHSFASAARTSVLLVGSMCLIMALEVFVYPGLAKLGIVPRTEAGLIGIAFAPLLHGSWQHLAANAPPLLVMLILLLSNPAYRPYATLAWVWIFSGLGTWLIGRGDAVHIGASSVIFGLAAFLIAAGFFLKSWRSAFVAILVFLLYGGIFYGVLPQNGPISWEGHLSGAIAGFWAAFAQRRK